MEICKAPIFRNPNLHRLHRNEFNRKFYHQKYVCVNVKRHIIYSWSPGVAVSRCTSPMGCTMANTLCTPTQNIYNIRTFLYITEINAGWRTTADK